MLPDRRDIASAPPMAVSGHVSAAADVHPVKTVLTPLSRVIVGPPALHHNAWCTSQPVSGGRPTRFMRRPLDRDPTRNAPISCV